MRDRAAIASKAALERAMREMADANLIGDAPISLIAGPEEYRFGEEEALLEVIEGNDPMPRWLPPYMHGLYATTPQEGWSAGSGPADTDDTRVGSNPTLVTKVETLANVSLIVTRGAESYRTIGTLETPGPLICTVIGDVAHVGPPRSSRSEKCRAVSVAEISGIYNR